MYYNRPMKPPPLSLLSLAAALLLFVSATGCRTQFAPALEKGEAAFAEGDYITTVDTLNLALLKWREPDGTESKARAFELLGASYDRLHNPGKAKNAYIQAVALSTRTYTALTNLGKIQLAANEPEKAYETFTTAVRRRPTDPLAHLGVANSLYALGRRNEAIAAYRKVLQVSPGVEDALASLEQLRRQPKPRSRRPSRRRRR